MSNQEKDGEKAAVTTAVEPSGGDSDVVSERDRDDAVDDGARPRAYILHRTNGTGRSHPIPEGEESDAGRKPPCFVCYVPFPVYHLARFLEQNFFCEAFGRIGCFGHDNHEIRYNILLFGLVANGLSFLLSLFACFSLSLKFNHIVAGGFSKGLAYIPQLDLPTSRIWIGLRGVAIRNFPGQQFLNDNYYDGDRVIEFDDFCDYVDRGLENYVMDAEDCNSCAEASSGMVTAVIMATLLTLPNIFTDILRMYPNYDLNCQKFFGSVLNLASAASSLYAYRSYATLCFRAFYDDGEDNLSVPLFDSNNATAMDLLVSSVREQNPNFSAGEIPDELGLSFRWRPGNGLICIVLATLLKVFDIIAMLLIPTPDIAHSKSLQEEYEALYGEEADDDDDENDGEETNTPKTNETGSGQIENC